MRPTYWQTVEAISERLPKFDIVSSFAFIIKAIYPERLDEGVFTKGILKIIKTMKQLNTQYQNIVVSSLPQVL